MGQKTKLTRRWAQRGTRPQVPADERTKSAYIFGAICPQRGVGGAAIVMPNCNTHAMQAHLEEIGRHVKPKAHVVLLLDRAGWHTTAALTVPDNMTLLPLPARAPELNPDENVWQFMRDNWLSNLIFNSYEGIESYCCEAWNILINQTERITSIGMRKWAHRF